MPGVKVMVRPVSCRVRPHGPIVVIVVAFLLLGVTYSIVNPLFESPDEVWHYQYVKYLADGHGLPVSDLVTEMPWHQEGSQPPLYYLLGATVVSWVDTSDTESVIRYNPHAAVGLGDAPDNKNMMVHTSLEAFPYRGTALSAHLVRLVSVLMGAATVLCTYLISRIVFPSQRAVSVVAAAVNAFNPQFIFISASVNNDNLAILLCSASLLLLLRIWQGMRKPAHFMLLGVLTGLAAISKLSGLVLLPFVALLPVVVFWRERSLRSLVRSAPLVGVPLLAVAGWWYWRNWLLYRDPFGLAAMFAVLPARSEGPGLSELLARAEGVWRSAWAVFGWFNVLADPWLYAAYSALSLIGISGLALLGLRRARRERHVNLPVLAWLALWSVTVLVALVAWSHKRYPQGRLLFPAISAASALWGTGLAQWTPRRWPSAWATPVSIGLFCLAAWVPFRYIAPAYAPPPTVANLPAGASHLSVDFGGQAKLVGYQLGRHSVSPGQTLTLTLYWQAVTPMSRDYSVFVHLVDEEELIVAQRDSFPGGGSAITSSWQPGQVVTDQHKIQIPQVAPAPCQTRLRIGLYDYQSRTRLLTPDTSDYVQLGTISIVPAQGTVTLPNPVYFDFEGKLALVGFDLDRRAIRPGETLHLTLYWRALSSMEQDYTVFTHLLLPPDQVWAQEDDQPQDGQAPTSSWQPGQLIEDHYFLALPAETPPGVYEIEVGVYLSTTGARLKVGLSDQGIVLAKIRVHESESAAVK